MNATSSGTNSIQTDRAQTPPRPQLSTQQPSEPRVTAKAYLVGNISSGYIYKQFNSQTALPVASMSKLVTALAATTKFPQNARITITPEEMNVPPDGSQLAIGETYTVQELMYPLLLNSSNVAAEALASSSNRSGFIELMSSYVWEIGMPSTFFADPSGLNPHNEASARDLFTLAKYLTKYRPDILQLTRTLQATTATTSDHGSHVFNSTHPLIKEPGFLGGKTGRTLEAGETMLTIMKINDQPIAYIILGSEYGARERDTRLLIQQTRALVR